MGLFSSSKKIYVSSTVYSMSGDENERVNFLKTVVVGSVLTPRKISLTDAMTQAYIGGPGIKLRKIYRWAAANYNTIGLPLGRSLSSYRINYSQVRQEIPDTDSALIELRAVETGPADFSWWAEQWILANEPELFETEWSADIDDDFSEITIFRADGSSVIFAPQGFDRGSLYLYALWGTKDMSTPRVFIYEHKSGNAKLDVMIRETTGPESDWFPVIPVRLDNKFVTELGNDALYSDASKLYKKATNEPIESLIDKLADNEGLKDIDYAHVVFGVPLNTKEPAGLKYIYQFFLQRLAGQATGSAYYESWKAQQEAYETAAQEWIEWRDEQGFIPTGSHTWQPGQPQFPQPPLAPWSMASVRHDPGSPIDYDIDINWGSISQRFGNGQAKPGAKAGEIWWENRASFDYKLFGNDGKVVTKSVSGSESNATLVWQETANSWRALDFKGLVHKNFVYKGKFVEISASEALADEDLSGFIVPMQYSVLQRLSLVESTQMAGSTMYLVLNSYKVVKRKWYQKGIFKIVLIVAIVALIYFTGGFSATGLGVLGTNVAVGTAIGLTGVAAVIAGFVANAIAAMVITSVITKGATAAFGAKIGAIVGVIASLVVVNGLTNMAGGNGFAINFGDMSKAENLLRLASSASSAYSGYVEASIADIARETQDMLDEYKSETEKLSALYEELIGYDRGMIDPMSFTDAGNAFIESSGSFLGRTLMTGSDIADLSLEMLSNFADITLSTELSLDA